MAKATLSIQKGSFQSFGQQKKLMRKGLSTNIGLQVRRGQVILHKASKTRKVASPAQKAWRLFYAICDCMYRHMTYRQKLLWMRYYFYSRYRKWTLRKPKRRKTTSYEEATSKHLSDYAYFMKRALTWNLKYYLEHFLGAQIYVLSYSISGGKLTVEGVIANEVQYQTLWENWEGGKPEVARWR